MARGGLFQRAVLTVESDNLRIAQFCVLLAWGFLFYTVVWVKKSNFALRAQTLWHLWNRLEILVFIFLKNAAYFSTMFIVFLQQQCICHIFPMTTWSPLPAPMRIQSNRLTFVQAMSILIVNQSVIDMCASLFCFLLVKDMKMTGLSRDSIYDQFVCRFWLTRRPLCMVYAGDVDLRNCHHDIEPLHCCHLSNKIQDGKHHFDYTIAL